MPFGAILGNDILLYLRGLLYGKTIENNKASVYDGHFRSWGYRKYHGSMYWPIICSLVSWKSSCRHDHWIEFRNHTQIYFWSHAQVAVRICSFLNANSFYSRLNFWICSWISYRPSLNIWRLHMEILSMFSNNNLHSQSN